MTKLIADLKSAIERGGGSGQLKFDITVHEEDPEQAVREKAYEIYLRRGRESGREQEDWHQAKRELGHG